MHGGQKRCLGAPLYDIVFDGLAVALEALGKIGNQLTTEAPAEYVHSLQGFAGVKGVVEVSEVVDIGLHLHNEIVERAVFRLPVEEGPVVDGEFFHQFKTLLKLLANFNEVPPYLELLVDLLRDLLQLLEILLFPLDDFQIIFL